MKHPGCQHPHQPGGRGDPHLSPAASGCLQRGWLSQTWQRVSNRKDKGTKDSSRLHRSGGQRAEARTSGPTLCPAPAKGLPWVYLDKGESFRRKHPILLLNFPGWKAFSSPSFCPWVGTLSSTG